jgi:glycosyltransferase involved in cell wall biosynthesis
MYRNKKISVCLPCRNEAAHLSVVVKRIPEFVDEIIVISNNSTDKTVATAKRLGLKVFEDNRVIDGIGYGFAHMTGIKNATGDIIVGADGDATYPIEDLGDVIDYLLDKKLGFVSCNRYPLQAGTKIPFKLRFGVWLLNTEVRLLYGQKINDILSGMWVFTKVTKPKLGLTMGDWNLSPQIKLNAALNPKIKFAEFSIAQHQRLGESHQAHFKTGFSHLVWILKNRWRPTIK